MNPKTIKTLLVIFIGLVFIIFEINWLKKSENKNLPVRPDFNLEKIKEGQTEKIIIAKGEDKKEFARNGSQWLLGSKEVSDAEIKSFFEELEEMKILEIASRNKNNQENFGMEDEQVYILEFISKENGQKFLIGKPGLKSNSFYIKKDGSGNVYLAGGSLLSKILQTEDVWLGKENQKKNESEKNSKAEKE